MRLSTNLNVQEAIRGQLGLDKLGGKLKKCLRESERIAKSVREPTTKLAAYREQRDTVMDYAKLTGQLVEKREVRDVTEHDSSAVRDLVSRSMRQPVSDAATDAVHVG